jgi:general secretion pathway protein D
MKKVISGFIFFLLLLPVSGFADETADIANPNTTESAQSGQQLQKNTLTEESAPESSTAESEIRSEPIEQVEPPQVPPAPSFTPEQIKAFLSKQKENNYIILNFDNANLKDVINTISSITGENFILSPGLDARITIHSAGKIPVNEAMSVFESILEVNNMSLVKSGLFYKIVPGPTAKQKAIEVQKGKEAEDVSSADRPITQVIPVEYVPVTELIALTQPMLSPFGSIIANPRNNLLIINDIASNLKRLLSVLKEIDVDAFQNTRMSFFKPKYSDVRSIAEEVMEIINALNLGKDGTIAIVPVERINSLIVFSSSPSLLKSVEGWLKKLDEEYPTERNVFVYPVQNVKAESIVEILKTLYKEEDSKTARTVTTPQRRTRGPQVTAPVSPEARVEFVAFEPTNSLVILAPPGMYAEITEIIKRLDVYPHEVLIEVIIAEVILTDTDKFGIQWSVLHDVHIEGGEFRGLIQSTSGASEAAILPSIEPTLNLGLTGLSYFLFKPNRLAALVHALASRGKVNILSSPRLLVKDQGEASIEVGSDVPIATSTTATPEVATLTQNIEYKTVGIKLMIKPSINDEKTVVLDIEQEVSDVFKEGRTVGQFTYPEFSTRKTKTSIIVPDKQGIIIGGIMKEKKEKGYQGIPLLSAIPILGNLFRYTIDTREKTELIVLLTPHVITNRTEADVLTMEFLGKLKEVKEFLKKNKDQINIPPLEENKTSLNQQ